MSNDEFVRGLLEMQGLTVSPTEAATIASSFEWMRAGIDSLYSVPMLKEQEMALLFSPYEPPKPLGEDIEGESR